MAQIPPNLMEVMKELSKYIVKDNPNDVYEYAYEFFNKKIIERDGHLYKNYEVFEEQQTKSGLVCKYILNKNLIPNNIKQEILKNSTNVEDERLFLPKAFKNSSKNQKHYLTENPPESVKIKKIQNKNDSKRNLLEEIITEEDEDLKNNKTQENEVSPNKISEENTATAAATASIVAVRMSDHNTESQDISGNNSKIVNSSLDVNVDLIKDDNSKSVEFIKSEGEAQDNLVQNEIKLQAFEIDKKNDEELESDTTKDGVNDQNLTCEASDSQTVDINYSSAENEINNLNSKNGDDSNEHVFHNSSLNNDEGETDETGSIKSEIVKQDKKLNTHFSNYELINEAEKSLEQTIIQKNTNELSEDVKTEITEDNLNSIPNLQSNIDGISSELVELSSEQNIPQDQNINKFTDSNITHDEPCKIICDNFSQNHLKIEHEKEIDILKDSELENIPETDEKIISSLNLADSYIEEQNLTQKPINISEEFHSIQHKINTGNLHENDLNILNDFDAEQKAIGLYSNMIDINPEQNIIKKRSADFFVNSIEDFEKDGKELNTLNKDLNSSELTDTDLNLDNTTEATKLENSENDDANDSIIKLNNGLNIANNNINDNEKNIDRIDFQQLDNVIESLQDDNEMESLQDRNKIKNHKKGSLSENEYIEKDTSRDSMIEELNIGNKSSNDNEEDISLSLKADHEKNPEYLVKNNTSIIQKYSVEPSKEVNLIQNEEPESSFKNDMKKEISAGSSVGDKQNHGEEGTIEFSITNSYQNDSEQIDKNISNNETKSLNENLDILSNSICDNSVIEKILTEKSDELNKNEETMTLPKDHNIQKTNSKSSISVTKTSSVNEELKNSGIERSDATNDNLTEKNLKMHDMDNEKTNILQTTMSYEAVSDQNNNINNNIETEIAQNSQDSLKNNLSESFPKDPIDTSSIETSENLNKINKDMEEGSFSENIPKSFVDIIANDVDDVLQDENLNKDNSENNNLSGLNIKNGLILTNSKQVDKENFSTEIEFVKENLQNEQETETISKDLKIKNEIAENFISENTPRKFGNEELKILNKNINFDKNILTENTMGHEKNAEQLDNENFDKETKNLEEDPDTLSNDLSESVSDNTIIERSSIDKSEETNIIKKEEIKIFSKDDVNKVEISEDNTSENMSNSVCKELDITNNEYSNIENNSNHKGMNSSTSNSISHNGNIDKEIKVFQESEEQNVIQNEEIEALPTNDKISKTIGETTLAENMEKTSNIEQWDIADENSDVDGNDIYLLTANSSSYEMNSGLPEKLNKKTEIDKNSVDISNNLPESISDNSIQKSYNETSEEINIISKNLNAQNKISNDSKFENIPQNSINHKLIDGNELEDVLDENQLIEANCIKSLSSNQTETILDNSILNEMADKLSTGSNENLDKELIVNNRVIDILKEANFSEDNVKDKKNNVSTTSTINMETEQFNNEKNNTKPADPQEYGDTLSHHVSESTSNNSINKENYIDQSDDLNIIQNESVEILGKDHIQQAILEGNISEKKINSDSEKSVTNGIINNHNKEENGMTKHSNILTANKKSDETTLELLDEETQMKEDYISGLIFDKSINQKSSTDSADESKKIQKAEALSTDNFQHDNTDINKLKNYAKTSVHEELITSNPGIEISNHKTFSTDVSKEKNFLPITNSFEEPETNPENSEKDKTNEINIANDNSSEIALNNEPNIDGRLFEVPKQENLTENNSKKEDILSGANNKDPNSCNNETKIQEENSETPLPELFESNLHKAIIKKKPDDSPEGLNTIPKISRDDTNNISEKLNVEKEEEDNDNKKNIKVPEQQNNENVNNMIESKSHEYLVLNNNINFHNKNSENETSTVKSMKENNNTENYNKIPEVIQIKPVSRTILNEKRDYVNNALLPKIGQNIDIIKEEFTENTIRNEIVNPESTNNVVTLNNQKSNKINEKSDEENKILVPLLSEDNKQMKIFALTNSQDILDIVETNSAIALTKLDNQRQEDSASSETNISEISGSATNEEISDEQNKLLLPLLSEDIVQDNVDQLELNAESVPSKLNNHSPEIQLSEIKEKSIIASGEENKILPSLLLENGDQVKKFALANSQDTVNNVNPNIPHVLINLDHQSLEDTSSSELTNTSGTATNEEKNNEQNKILLPLLSEDDEEVKIVTMNKSEVVDNIEVNTELEINDKLSNTSEGKSGMQNKIISPLLSEDNDQVIIFALTNSADILDSIELLTEPVQSKLDNLSLEDTSSTEINGKITNASGSAKDEEKFDEQNKTLSSLLSEDIIQDNVDELQINTDFVPSKLDNHSQEEVSLCEIKEKSINTSGEENKILTSLLLEDDEQVKIFGLAKSQDTVNNVDPNTTHVLINLDNQSQEDTSSSEINGELTNKSGSAKNEEKSEEQNKILLPLLSEDDEQVKIVTMNKSEDVLDNIEVNTELEINDKLSNGSGEKIGKQNKVISPLLSEDNDQVIIFALTNSTHILDGVELLTEPVQTKFEDTVSNETIDKLTNANVSATDAKNIDEQNKPLSSLLSADIVQDNVDQLEVNTGSLLRKLDNHSHEDVRLNQIKEKEPDQIKIVTTNKSDDILDIEVNSEKNFEQNKIFLPLLSEDDDQIKVFLLTNSKDIVDKDERNSPELNKLNINSQEDSSSNEINDKSKANGSVTNEEREKQNKMHKSNDIDVYVDENTEFDLTKLDTELDSTKLDKQSEEDNKLNENVLTQNNYITADGKVLDNTQLQDKDYSLKIGEDIVIETEILKMDMTHFLIENKKSQEEEAVCNNLKNLSEKNPNDVNSFENIMPEKVTQQNGNPIDEILNTLGKQKVTAFESIENKSVSKAIDDEINSLKTEENNLSEIIEEPFEKINHSNTSVEITNVDPSEIYTDKISAIGEMEIIDDEGSNSLTSTKDTSFTDSLQNNEANDERSSINNYDSLNCDIVDEERTSKVMHVDNLFDNDLNESNSQSEVTKIEPKSADDVQNSINYSDSIEKSEEQSENKTDLKLLPDAAVSVKSVHNNEINVGNDSNYGVNENGDETKLNETIVLIEKSIIHDKIDMRNETISLKDNIASAGKTSIIQYTEDDQENVRVELTENQLIVKDMKENSKIDLKSVEPKTNSAEDLDLTAAENNLPQNDVLPSENDKNYASEVVLNNTHRSDQPCEEKIILSQELILTPDSQISIENQQNFEGSKNSDGKMVDSTEEENLIENIATEKLIIKEIFWEDTTPENCSGFDANKTINDENKKEINESASKLSPIVKNKEESIKEILMKEKIRFKSPSDPVEVMDKLIDNNIDNDLEDTIKYKPDSLEALYFNIKANNYLSKSKSLNAENLRDIENNFNLIDSSNSGIEDEDLRNDDSSSKNETVGSLELENNMKLRNEIQSAIELVNDSSSIESTITESTIINAVTKIQAVGRGYLTRLKLKRGDFGKSLPAKHYYKSYSFYSTDSMNLDRRVSKYDNVRKSNSWPEVKYVGEMKYLKKLELSSILKSNDYDDSDKLDDEKIRQSSALASRRLTLQRTDAIQINSTENTVESQTEVKKKVMQEKDIEKKWLMIRQYTMPVQIDAHVMRLMPKHMRKRIQSADAEKRKERKTMF